MGGYIPEGAYNPNCFFLLSGIWVFKWGAYKWGRGAYIRGQFTVYPAFMLVCFIGRLDEQQRLVYYHSASTCKELARERFQ